MNAAFNGFSKEFFGFYRELAKNNDKTWFAANKERYKDQVVAPMSAFIEAMAPRLKKVSPHFIADPRPHGGSMFRIYRDARFSHDKRPYKEHAACQFRHRLGRDVHAPGFYVHLEPGEVRYGGGVWLPPPPALAAVRHRIAEKPGEWSKVLADKGFQDYFGGVSGEALSRPPRGFDPGLKHMEDIKRKSFFAMAGGTMKDVARADFVDQVTDAFMAMRPLMRFLGKALEAPF